MGRQIVGVWEGVGSKFDAVREIGILSTGINRRQASANR